MSEHVKKAGQIQGDRMARAMGNASATAQLLAHGLDKETVEEFINMSEAAWTRLCSLQHGWMRDWSGWLDYARTIKGANTLSKLVERESNILGQATQLLGAQVTDLTGLQENIEIDYAYWVRGKLAAKQQQTRESPGWPTVPAMPYRLARLKA